LETYLGELGENGGLILRLILNIAGFEVQGWPYVIRERAGIRAQ
jgi:hypothetical protein